MKKFYPSGYAGFIFTLIFSVAFILTTFSWAYIVGIAPYWQNQASDIAQHLSGINLYVSSPWQFPLLAFNSLNYPQGSNVVFVDGIPIVAFILKLFLSRDVAYFNPLGYWVALNFILQSVSAWWIMRELQIKSWAYLIFFIWLLLTFPPFTGWSHLVALMSHWVLLFAIALYLRSYRLQKINIIAWTAFLTASFYIHVYLFAMASMIYVATVFDVKHKINFRYLIKISTPLLAWGVSLFLLPLPPGNIQKPNDFAAYALNLLQPVVGGKLIQLQVDVSHNLAHWYYLGLGIILLCLWCLLFSKAQWTQLIKRRKAFFVVILLLFFYSLSNQIYAGGKLLAIVNYPEFLTPVMEQLRCSGRFFWPAAYVAVIVSLTMLYRSKSPRSFIYIMLLFIIIQYFDTQTTRGDLLHAKKAKQNIVINFQTLQSVVGDNVKYIYLYPKYGCSKDEDYTFHVVTPLMQYSAMQHLKLNTGFVARFGSNCSTTVKEIAASRKNESAYIFSVLAYHNQQMIHALFDKNEHISCKKLDFAYICHVQNGEK